MNFNDSTQTPLPHQTQPYFSPSDSQFSEGDLSTTSQSERRRNQRIPVSAWAQVRGSDPTGARFEASHDAAQLQDLSANGLRLSLQHAVGLGQRLFIVFPGVLSMLAGKDVPSSTRLAPASIAVIGIVRRCRAGDTGCQVGVEIVRHRFVYSA
ncbi:MAG TPA: PilZ domain-containing protein [Abditibacteriaceae bacterium]